MGNNNSLPIINSHVHIIPLTLTYLIHISSPHPRCCLPLKPINISRGGGISATIPIHHLQSEHICSSQLVFPNSLFLLELTTLQGNEDPNVLSSSKAPQTNPHLKQKRDSHHDSTDPPPTKRTPRLVFPGFPLPIWAHSSDAGVIRSQYYIILESAFYRNQSSPEVEEGSLRWFHRFTICKANTYDHLG